MSVYGFSSSLTVPLKRGELLTVDSVRKERWMSLFHKAVKVVVAPLQTWKPRGFVVKTWELVE